MCRTSGIAGEGDIFIYQKDLLEIEMAELQALENLVTEGSFLISRNPCYNEGHTEPLNTAGIIAAIDLPEEIPSFAWGCVLSGLGVVLVHNATNDTEETKKAFMGCIVNGVVVTGIYIINLLATY
jgi:hypothetical protein